MSAALGAEEQAAVVAAAAGLAAALLLPPPVRDRHARPRAADDAARDVADRALLLRWRPLLASLAYLGGWVLVGGVVGLVAGGVAAVAAWRVLGRAESPSSRRRREELERDLPTAVQLLAACLRSGAATTVALGTVAEALPGAVAEELLLLRHRLALGVDPGAVWQELARHPQLRPLGRAMARAHRSGAPVSATAEALAAELAARSRARSDALARSVEVKAAAPLGLCFLPAFLLLGVLPLVVGVFSSMRFFG